MSPRSVPELIEWSRLNRRSQDIRRQLCPPLSEYDRRRRAIYRQESLSRLRSYGHLTGREYLALVEETIREDQPLVAAVWDAENAEEEYRLRMRRETRRRRREREARL